MTRETDDDDGAALADAPPAFDYGLFSFTSKAEVLEKAKEYWNPGKTQFWIDSGVPLVIDRREEYFIYDMSGKRLIDAHLNGGTYNLGHRNPEVVQAIITSRRWPAPRSPKRSSRRPRPVSRR